MEARNRQLPEWLSKINTGQIELPRFQRMESWGYREITDLLNAILQGLPIGSVLVMEIGDEKPFVSRALSGVGNGSERTTELLLDGQQRLTALWRSLNNDYDDRKYFVDISSGVSEEYEAVSEARWERNGKIYPLWADDPKGTWERGLVPIRLLRPDETAEHEADKWVEAAVEGDLKADKKLSREITKLRHEFAKYTLPFLFLEVGTAKEVALDVFIKMNTRMVKLTTFDIIVAQTEEATGRSLHDLVESLASTVPHLSAYDDPEDVVLDVMALFQDRVPSKSGYLGLDFSKMVDDWPKMVEAAKQAITFLEQESVYDSDRIPTETVVSPLIALWSEVADTPDATGNARILLRKYLWRSFFTERYERAVSTAVLQDFRALRGVLRYEASEDEVPIFNEAEYVIPPIEAILQAKWPKRRDRLARAILQLSLRGGALDIADGASVSRDQLKRREYHHLYPKALLIENGIEEDLANRSLNCALISWKTNRTISAKEPLKYLRERADASTLGEREIRSRLSTHAIPFDDLAGGDFQGFLEARAHILVEGMKSLYRGEDWHP